MLKEIEFAAVVQESLVQLADGGASREFALQTVERRLDRCVDGCQVATRLRLRQCDDDETQHLAERAANAKSIARFGTAFGLHQAVDFTLAGGVGTQQKRKRVLHPGCESAAGDESSSFRRLPLSPAALLDHIMQLPKQVSLG